jgi:hypothetical protein
MTKEELIKKLKQQHDNSDKESAHGQADDLLLEFISDEKITKAYADVPKWYA